MNRAERRRREKAARKSNDGSQSAAADQRYDIANQLAGEGLYVQAEKAYYEALDLKPEFPEALSNLGSLHQVCGRLPEAEVAYRKAATLLPGNALILSNLANVLKGLDDGPGAITAYQSALKVDPANADNHFSLAELLLDRGDVEAAIVAYQSVLKITPQNVAAQTNLGNLFARTMQFELAITTHLAALEVSPTEPTILLNLGLAYRWNGQPIEAAEVYRRALAITPDDCDLLALLGSACMESGDAAQALKYFDHVLSLKPDDPEVLSFRASPLLVLQDFDAGYQAQTYADQAMGRIKPYTSPEWQGEDLRGKSIIVWAEEGVGDEVLFASCLSDLIDLSERCTIVTDARLVELFSRSFPGVTIVAKPGAALVNEHFDYQIGMAALPRRLRRDLKSFSEDVGYLVPESNAVSQWKTKLAALGDNLKVGLFWRSGLVTVERHRDYPAFSDWVPVLSLPDANFISLQYGDALEDLGTLDRTIAERVQVFNDMDFFDDLDGSAALMSSLDLVITPLAATAWIAASVGVPTWVLNRPGDWRQFGTDHYPWLPSVRMFTKPADERWTETLEHVAHELTNYVAP